MCSRVGLTKFKNIFLAQECVTMSGSSRPVLGEADMPVRVVESFHALAEKTS